MNIVYVEIDGTVYSIRVPWDNAGYYRDVRLWACGIDYCGAMTAVGRVTAFPCPCGRVFNGPQPRYGQDHGYT